MSRRGAKQAFHGEKWKETTEHGPIMHPVLHGITRGQFVARHHENHVNVAQASSAQAADQALAAKAMMHPSASLRQLVRVQRSRFSVPYDERKADNKVMCTSLPRGGCGVRSNCGLSGWPDQDAGRGS